MGSSVMVIKLAAKFQQKCCCQINISPDLLPLGLPSDVRDLLAAIRETLAEMGVEL